MELEDKVPNIVVKYIYKEDINRVFKVLKHIKHFSQIIGEFCDYVKMTKGNDIDEVGAIFQFKWKGVATVDVKIGEIIDTENFKKIQLRAIKVVPFGINYTINYYLYKNTIDFNTLLVYEMIFDNYLSMNIHDQQLNKKEKLALIKKIEKYLRKSTFDLNQSESITLDKPINDVWDVITDWGKFKNLVPMIAEEVEVEGDRKLNSVIKVKFPSKRIEQHLKVIKYEEIGEKKQYVLDLIDATPKSPKQEIHFNLVSLGKDKCFVVFKHIFKDPVPYKYICKLAKDKQVILDKLKKSLS